MSAVASAAESVYVGIVCNVCVCVCVCVHACVGIEASAWHALVRYKQESFLVCASVLRLHCKTVLLCMHFFSCRDWGHAAGCTLAFADTPQAEARQARPQQLGVSGASQLSTLSNPMQHGE